MAQTITKEVKVGILALVAGIMLYVGFNFLKGNSFFSATYKYYVVYDNVEGLTTSNPVLLHGVSIGRVSGIELLPERNNSILVTLEVENDIVIGDSTVAMLISSGLLSGKSIDLKMGKSTRTLSNGDTLSGFKEKAISEMISEKALPILANLDSTAVKLNAVFGDQLGESVTNTLKNFELASFDLKQTIALNKKNISGITSNLNTLTGSLIETEKSLKPVLSKMSAFADSLNDLDLKRTVARANAALQNVNEVTNKINQGNGTLGLLVNDKGLYQRLENSAKDLDLLLIDVRQNPKRYVHFSVFGGGNKKDKVSEQTETAQ